MERALVISAAMAALAALAAGCSGAMYPMTVIKASNTEIPVEPPPELRAGCSPEPAAIGAHPIDGCLVRGDTVDTFWIEVPADRDTEIYRIEIQPHSEYLKTELRLGEEVLERAVIGRGRRWSRRARLLRGRRYQIQLEHHSSAFVRYRLSAMPVSELASSR